MAKSVAQLTAQMHRIQQQIDVAKAKEIAGVVSRIQEAIAYYGLTSEQLFPRHERRGKRVAASLNSAKPRGETKASEKRSGRAKTAGVKLPAKYSDGAGNSWTGRGSTPRWLAEAIASGKQKEEFAVKA